MASSQRASAWASCSARCARRRLSSLSVSAQAISASWRSRAEHSDARRALAASASAAAFLSARASSRALASSLRSAFDCLGLLALGWFQPEHEVDVILDAAGIILGAAVIDEESRRRSARHVAVVADEDDRAVIAVSA